MAFSASGGGLRASSCSGAALELVQLRRQPPAQLPARPPFAPAGLWPHQNPDNPHSPPSRACHRRASGAAIEQCFGGENKPAWSTRFTGRRSFAANLAWAGGSNSCCQFDVEAPQAGRLPINTADRPGH